VPDKLNKEQREARAQRIKMLRDVARAWEGRVDGRDNDYAARLRAEARMMANDQDFADMDKQRERYKEIANTVTAETEAKRERQRAKAQKPRPRLWHKAADPILDELRGNHPDWSRSDLRHVLEKRLKELGVKFPRAEAVAAYIRRHEDAKGVN
jgi:hypothetical protein